MAHMNKFHGFVLGGLLFASQPGLSAGCETYTYSCADAWICAQKNCFNNEAGDGSTRLNIVTALFVGRILRPEPAATIGHRHAALPLTVARAANRTIHGETTLTIGLGCISNTKTWIREP